MLLQSVVPHCVCMGLSDTDLESPETRFDSHQKM